MLTLSSGIKLLNNVTWFAELNKRSCRELWLNFKKIKVKKNKVLIRFSEINKYAYFIIQGTVNVYVVTDEKDSTSLNETIPGKNNQKYLLQTLKKGSSMNLANSFLKQASLFEFRCSTDWVLIQLKRKDLVEVARTNQDLQHALTTLKARYRFKGVKYDFYTYPL